MTEIRRVEGGEREKWKAVFGALFGRSSIESARCAVANEVQVVIPFCRSSNTTEVIACVFRRENILDSVHEVKMAATSDQAPLFWTVAPGAVRLLADRTYITPTLIVNFLYVYQF